MGVGAAAGLGAAGGTVGSANAGQGVAAASAQQGAGAANTNSAPAFGATSYSFTLTPSTDGRLDAAAVGATSATDTDSGDTLTYSLRSSDSADTLYMVAKPGATANAALYQVDATAGTATAAGTAGASTGTGRPKLGGTVWHRGRLYAAAPAPATPDTAAQPGLHAIDIATGASARIATNAQMGLGSTASLLALASHNGVLYATTSDSGSGHVGLWRIDLSGATPAATAVGTSGMGASVTAPHSMASHNGTLYLGRGTGKLATVDPATGTAADVSSTLTNFGVSESAPLGLASHNGTLYMAGSTNKALYTLNTSTGAATRVASSVTAFGVTPAITAAGGLANGYTQPDGFAIDAATGAISYSGVPIEPGVYTLYAQVRDSKTSTGTADTAVDATVTVTVTVANTQPAFGEDSYDFTVTPATDASSTAVTVGTAAAADDHEHPLAYSLRASDPANTLYMVGQQHDALYKMNKTTGAVTRIGNATNFGADITSVNGMTWHNGKLHLVGSTTTLSDGVYVVDTETGVATLTARVSLLGGRVSLASGIASHEGDLYLIDVLGGSTPLKKLDLVAGTATSFGTAGFGVSETSPRGLVSHGSPAKLYMVGGTTDKLYTLNTTTGAATQVGNQSAGFGVSPTEGTPSGLASDGTNLYMVGAQRDQLYTLNTTTGVATKVGSSFGSTENNPQGLTAGYVKPSVVSIDAGTGAISYSGNATSSTYGNGWTVYAQVSDGLDANNHADAVIDDYAPVTVTAANAPAKFGQRSYEMFMPPATNGSTTAHTVGRAAATDPDTADTLTYSLKDSDASSRVYMIGVSTDALYVLDSSNFNQNAQRVNSAVSKFGVNEGTPYGLTWHNGKLYMLGRDADALYELNADTGIATRIGNVTAFGVGEALPAGLASHNDELYMAGDWHDALYRLNPKTGVATRIGNAHAFGPDSSDTRQRNPAGLASLGGTLYLIGYNQPQLSTLDTSTGIATHVSSEDFGFSETSTIALGVHGTTLYAYSFGVGPEFFSLTTAGVGERITIPTNFGVGERAVSGIATGYSKPANFAVQSDGDIEWSGTVAQATAADYTLYARVHDGKQGNNTADTATIDDTVPVTVKVTNQGPAFAKDAYDLALPADDTSHTLGTVAAADPESNTVAYSLRDDDTNTLYMVGASNDALYSVNKTTGAVTRIGSAANFDAGIESVGGIAWHNGDLYIVGNGSRASSVSEALYTVDSGTGVATYLADYSDLGLSLGEWGGIASHDGALYVLRIGSKPLVRIDVRDGTVWATALGSSGFGVGETTPSGLASHGSPPKLYMVGRNKSRLYTLNTTTGAATQVGTQSAGFGVSPTEGNPSGLASDGTNLYMVGRSNDRLYTLNTSTGAGTAVGSSFGSIEGTPNGLAGRYVLPSGFSVGASTGVVSYSGTSGLTAGTRNTLYVQANDGKSPSGGNSAAVDATVPVTVRVRAASAPTGPDRPQASAASGVGGQIDVAWAAPYDNGAPVGQYDVRYRPRSHRPAGAWSGWAHSGTGTGTVLNRGLATSTDYEVQVRARNSAGAGAWSNSGYALTGSATKPPAPAAPTVRAGNDKIRVSWPLPGDGGSPLTSVVLKSQKADGTGTVYTKTLSNTAQVSDLVPSSAVVNGTPYKVWLTATNAKGTTVGAKSASVTPAVGPPDAPTQLVALVPAGQYGRIALTWNAPSDNGGAALSGYKLQQRVRTAGSDGSWGPWTAVSSVTLDGSSTGAAVRDLLAADEYQWRVAAVNANGDSPWLYEAADAAPQSPLLGTPTVSGAALAAVSGTGGQLSLSWTSAKRNGAPIVDYDVQYRACTASCSAGTPTWGTWTDRAGETAADLPTSPLVISGLTAATKYGVQMRAANGTASAREGAWTTAVTATTNAAVAPGAPTEVRADAKNTAAAVTWTAPVDDGGAAISGYTVTATPTSGSAVTKTVGGSVRATKMTGLSNSATYSVTVAATNSVGTGTASTPAVTVEPTTVAPDAPTGITATAGNAKLTVSWTAPADNGGSAISGYKAYYRTTGSATAWTTPANANTTCDSTTVSSTSCEISSLTNGVRHEVTVRATNSIDDGDWPDPSGHAFATPGKPDTPADLEVAFGVTSSDRLRATLSASISGNGGSAITGWQYQRVTGAATAFGTTWTDLSSTSSPTLSKGLWGHTAGTTYKFRVRAKSAIGTSDPSNVVTVTVAANLAPVFGTTASQVSSFAWDLAAGTTGTTAEPAAIGTAAAADWDSGDTLTWGLYADTATTLYTLQSADTVGDHSDALYRVDTATGAATRVGAAVNLGQGTTDVAPLGLTWHRGRLLSVQARTLYELNPVTGAMTTATAITGLPAGTSNIVTGLTSTGSTLYLLSNGTDNTAKLYTLNPRTGAATEAGALGGGSANPRVGLAWSGTTLYTLHASGDYLESINTSTGAATQVGCTGTGQNKTCPAAGYGQSETAGAGLTWHSGTLYMVGGSNDHLYTLDTATGAAAKVGTGLGAGVTVPVGLAGGHSAPSGFAVASSTGAVGYTSSTAAAIGRYRLWAQVRDSKSSAGVADTVWDVTAPVTVDVVNTPPAFAASSYTARLRSG